MAKSYDIAVKIAGKVDPSLIASSKKASGLISSIVKADLIASGIKKAGSSIVSFASESVKSFATFEQSLANAGAIAGATGADLQAMKEAAMEAGRTTQYTAAQSADALGYMALAGWDTKTSIQALQPVLKIAQATGADLATTSDQVTDSMSAMGIGVNDLNSYLDVLITTNNKSNTTASALMEAMIGAGSAAKAAGMDYKQTAAALGVLANNGIKGAEAGTALNSMLSRMTSNKQALKAYKQLGVNVFDANGKIRDFATILKETDTQLSKLSDEERASIIKDIAGVNYGGQYQFLLKGVRAIDGQASEWEKLKNNIDNASGSLETMNSKTTDTMMGAWARFQSAIDGARLALIDKFAPQIKIALDYISNNILPRVTKGIEFLTGAIISLVQKSINLINSNQELKSIFIALKNISVSLYGIIKNVCSVLFSMATGSDSAAAKMYILNNYGQSALNMLNAMQSVIRFVGSAMLFLTSKTLKLIAYLLDIKQVISDVNNFYNEHKTALDLAGIAIAGLTVALIAYKAAAIQAAINTKIITLALSAQAAILPIVNGLLTAFGAIWTFITSPIFLVVAAITAVIAVCYLLYRNWDAICAKISAAWQWLCGAVKGAWMAYYNYLANSFNAIKNAFLAVCNFIKSVFSTAINNAKIVLSGIIDFIKNVFTGNFKGAWDSITGIFTGVWENFKNIAKAPLNWIIDKINAVIRGINSVKAPDWMPGIGGKGANISEIPALASGGIVTKPTMALIGEGNESEAVIPLSKLERLMNGQNQTLSNNLNGLQRPSVANFGGGSVTFAPVINVTGGNSTASDVKQAIALSFEEFKRMMSQYENDKRRRMFNGY